jgi:hypothetical protein
VMRATAPMIHGLNVRLPAMQPLAADTISSRLAV